MKSPQSRPVPDGVRILADYGGTWTRVWAADSQGRILRSLKKPSPAPEKIPAFLRSTLTAWRLPHPDSLTIGARGFWKKEKRSGLRRQLKNLARAVTVLSDVEMAHRAAFGEKPGILILAGTGSIAYGVNSAGKYARAGGLGPEKGDEGSAFWIGRAYAERTGRKVPKTVRQTAWTARAVVRKAEAGDPLSKRIVQEAHDHLASLVLAVQRRLKIKKPVSVACAGGLFDDVYFKNGLIKILSALGFKIFSHHKNPIPSILKKNKIQ